MLVVTWLRMIHFNNNNNCNCAIFKMQFIRDVAADITLASCKAEGKKVV